MVGGMGTKTAKVSPATRPPTVKLRLVTVSCRESLKIKPTREGGKTGSPWRIAGAQAFNRDEVREEQRCQLNYPTAG